ncbi:hypothetical protein [Spiroplasma endosymbiont of Danaus chrysippus]|uniref:hypothetical protein n=1 Tax=Spiroplasma endosymbiont of Danaus chrysippus TaxID=2691041 RepID=UPI00157A75C3|nr:hypothetical protein [Spiroplasma endosymbiont of Danaus chrysippus]
MENKILIAITLEDLINILDNNLKDNNSIKILKEIIDKKYHYGVMQEKENTDLQLELIKLGMFSNLCDLQK